jgi:glyoxylase-like metal-dependent hydrolase (beta-lactamase superfamily II)
MKPGILWSFLLSLAAVNGVTADNGSLGTGGNVFTYRIGRFEVFMLVENRGQGRPSILIGADEAQIKHFFPRGSYQSQTNTFLIRGLGQCVLVDTGFGSTLFESMKTLNIDPSDVDTVLLTHMHGDHIGGLQKNGKALFPKAQVYLAQQEKDFWTGTNAGGNAAAALAPYGSRVKTFTPALLDSLLPQGGSGGSAVELLPGIIPIGAFGHTPGHTVFLVSDQGQRLLIAGDLVHVQDIQFPVPDVSVTYDTDPAAAAAVRRQVLDYAASNGIPIGGMHLVSPAVGTVSSRDGGYHFSPLSR